ncbi:MAG: PorT family protein [Bacteroidales bacterium]|nr:PorT family protein [Bacteroidales bacterium]
MKKQFIIILLFLVSFSAFSQVEKVQNLRLYDQKRLHFGFTVGLNTSDFYIRNSDTFFDTAVINEVYSIENKQQPGFHLGPISNLRIGKYFDLRFLINLNFTQRDLQYRILKENSAGESYFDTHTMKLSSTFLEFPFLIKYKSHRINNYRFYLIGGVKPSLDLAAKKKIPDELMPMIRLSQPDIYGEFGLGLDFYLPYFKFSPELKMGVGINNMAVDDNTEYTGAMKYLKSKVFMLSFHFE